MRGLTKTMSRFGWRISERRRLVNSSSLAPSNRLGFVNGLEDLRLLLIVGVVGVWGDEGIGDVVFVKIVEIAGRGEDDGGGDGETTFMIGEIIVLKHGDERTSEWDSEGMVGVFGSFSTVEIVSRFNDSRNFDRNTSATSSEPRVLFKALNKHNTRFGRWIQLIRTYSRLPPDSKFFLNVCINTFFTLSNASSNKSFVWLNQINSIDIKWT